MRFYLAGRCRKFATHMRPLLLGIILFNLTRTLGRIERYLSAWMMRAVRRLEAAVQLAAVSGSP
jgi:hypothetical protein